MNMNRTISILALAAAANVACGARDAENTNQEKSGIISHTDIGNLERRFLADIPEFCTGVGCNISWGSGKYLYYGVEGQLYFGQSVDSGDSGAGVLLNDTFHTDKPTGGRCRIHWLRRSHRHPFGRRRPNPPSPPRLAGSSHPHRSQSRRLPRVPKWAQIPDCLREF